MDKVLQQLTLSLAAALTQKAYRIATAESCTGGWVAEALTALAGSSNWFDRAYITYSNEAKRDMLGVSTATLQQHGAVSEAVVREMAQGVLARSGVDISVAISGIAGPGGAVPGKPVGTVWLAWARLQGDGRVGVVRTQCFRFFGNREQVRQQAVVKAIEGAIALCE